MKRPEKILLGRVELDPDAFEAVCDDLSGSIAIRRRRKVAPKLYEHNSTLEKGSGRGLQPRQHGG